MLACAAVLIPIGAPYISPISLIAFAGPSKPNKYLPNTGRVAEASGPRPAAPIVHIIAFLPSVIAAKAGVGASCGSAIPFVLLIPALTKSYTRDPLAAPDAAPATVLAASPVIPPITSCPKLFGILAPPGIFFLKANEPRAPIISPAITKSVLPPGIVSLNIESKTTPLFFKYCFGPCVHISNILLLPSIASLTFACPLAP